MELGDDALREHLAELDTPLVEGVDLPDHALGEHAVLVERDELTQGSGVSRSVSRTFVGRFPSKVRWGTSLPVVPSAFTCLAVFPKRCFGLGKDVGDQEVVMISKRVERLREPD